MHIINRRVKILLSLLLVIILVFTVASCTRESTPDISNQIPARSEAADRYKWDLTEFYENRQAFESDVALLRDEYIPALEEYQGKLNSAENILACFQLCTKATLIIQNVNVYPTFTADLDQTNAEATGMQDIASGLSAEFNGAVAFIEPEILALDETVLQGFLDTPALDTYHYYLQTLIDRKQHVLTDKEEQILARMSEIIAAPYDIFSKAQYADFTYPKFKDKDGKEIVLDWTAYDTIMVDPDREYRKRAYEAMWEAIRGINYTMAATYTEEVKINAFLAETRNYGSALEAALASESLPRSVYDNLLAATNDNLSYLHKYYGLVRKTLGLDDLHSYDMSLPLVDNYSRTFPYDEAVEIIAAALKPLGNEYIADYYAGINGRWLDVYADAHKYTGGYSWGTYTSHPYILLNYDNSLDWALGVAHEMGHALNTYYSNRTQDSWNSGYTILTAEVASLTNQLMMMDYLIKNATSDEEKLYLVLAQITDISKYFYTQVMYSEFEQTVHARAEAGEPLSADVINNIFLELLRKYRGPEYTVDDAGGAGWSVVPHFYDEFYVYKYAASIAVAYQIVNNILDGKEGALENYLAFLAAGGSDYPIELIKKAGVDINSPEPVNNLLAHFSDLVDEADRLLQKQAEK